MKKILSFVLIAACLFSLCGYTVWADEDTAALEPLQSGVEEATDETELWALAEEAYIYCYPLVLMEMTARTMPANTLVHFRSLATADDKSVVTLNVDTLYTQIILDVKDEPIILTLPETERFMEMQIMDAWSNTTAVLDKAGVYAFVKKGDTTELPENVTKVELPTSISWVLGRVILNGDNDLPNVVEIQDGMDLCPLSVYNSGEEHNNAMLSDEAINNDIVPVQVVAVMSAEEFFGLANELMADNPPADADKSETDRIAALGVAPGVDFDPAVLQDESGDGWKAMQQNFYTDIAAEALAFAKKLGIWNYFGEPIGDFGTEYTYRAAVAVSGFGANTTDVAIYPRCVADENGETFDGTQDYILHFDSLPPVLDKGFWSITAYGNDDFLIANPLNRYCVNDRSDFRVNDDGSLDILLTSNTDTESDLYVLPTDPEGFHLYMRIYLPDTEALDTWTAPVITKRAEENGGSDPQELKTILEENSFYVQQGVYRELDTVKEASAGRLLSCFGNNAGSAYIVFSMPAAPDQDTSLGSEERGWPDEIATVYDDPEIPNAPANPYFSPGGWEYKLRQDEVIVLITPLPGECKYYSFINYLMFTEQKPGKDYSGKKAFFSAGNEESGLYCPVFGSIGNSVNILNIKHTGDSIFDSDAVIVIGANRDAVNIVVEDLEEAGYEAGSINIMPIPAGTYKMGLQKGADTFSFLQRVSQPEDKDAYRDYLDNISERAVLYRVTPAEEMPENPYENETVIPRGNGVHETAALTDATGHLETIREALIAEYGDEYDYEELDSDIAVPEGLTAYYNDFNAKGDNRDAMYLMTSDFTLDSDEDFVVVYGVNHTATGKALYSNAVLYARPMLNGVTSIYDSMFEGSAEPYLGEDCEEADRYYVYKMARTPMDDYTALVEYSTGNEQGQYYGVDNGNPVIVAFRAYLDETGTGASYYEVIYDRTIVFHKKQVE